MRAIGVLPGACLCAVGGGMMPGALSLRVRGNSPVLSSCTEVVDCIAARSPLLWRCTATLSTREYLGS